MTSLINFWPVKRFLEYVIQRSIGKFLKNGFDLKSSDFSKKKITFKLLEINTKVRDIINCSHEQSYSPLLSFL